MVALCIRPNVLRTLRVVAWHPNRWGTISSIQLAAAAAATAAPASPLAAACRGHGKHCIWTFGPSNPENVPSLRGKLLQ